MVQAIFSFAPKTNENIFFVPCREVYIIILCKNRKKSVVTIFTKVLVYFFFTVAFLGNVHMKPQFSTQCLCFKIRCITMKCTIFLSIKNKNTPATIHYFVTFHVSNVLYLVFIKIFIIVTKYVLDKRRELPVPYMLGDLVEKELSFIFFLE